MSARVRIAVAGCAGRMGRAILRVVADRADGVISGGLEAAGSRDLGRDLGLLAGLEATGIAASADVAALLARSDVLIDFTAPAATAIHARQAAEAGVAVVVGTTGLSADEQGILDAAATRVPLLQAANMSLGVNLLIALARQVGAALGPDWDAEIVEMHHRHKVDAPSGTALALGAAVAAGRGVDLEAVAVRSRDGHTGARRAGDIGFASLRGGDVVGDHRLVFAGEAERIELAHVATDRAIFARGAVHAACWLAGRPPGRYGMADVLGF